MSDTAIGLLKSYGINPLPDMPTLPQLVADWAACKEFSPEAIIKLANHSVFGKVMHHYLMGATIEASPEETRGTLNSIGRNFVSHAQRGLSASDVGDYVGSREQNAGVDHALSETPRKNNKYGQGTSNRFSFASGVELPNSVRSVSIAVIGHGAAGILVERTLRSLGFSNITVYERTKSLGIWANENVYGRSRNNPLNLSWEGTELEAAPGSGTSVKSFLAGLASSANLKIGTVKKVTPRNYDHLVEFAETSAAPLNFPIVINCSGLGSPRPLSDRSRMTTSVTATYGGERWQRTLEAKQVRGKKLVFIGLGNSTAEMLRQIHNFQDQGIPVDYRIMTHYPKEAVYHPEDMVQLGRTKYRVFRDLSLPNLTSWQGDLGESRYDYYRALRTGKIMYGVKSWSRNGSTMVCHTNNGGYGRETINVDNLFTLIGYAPTKESMESHGMRVNPKDKCPELDYDGEVHSGNPGTGRRLFRGYFAFGAMTTNPQNKNAIVLPGMLFRLNDLVTSVILRAAEVSLSKD